MKKFTTSIAAIIFALFILTSCSAEEKEKDTDKKTKKSALDIKVADLKEPCDFADAMLVVETELKTLEGEVKKGEKPTEEQLKERKALNTKKYELRDATQNAKIDYKAYVDCPSMKEFNEKAEQSAQDTDKNTKKSAQDTDKKTKKSAQDTDKNTKKSAQDIKEADLKEPCDFVDAMLAVATEMNAIKGEVKEGEEPTSEQGKSMMVLMNIMNNVQVAAQNADLDPDDMQDCPSMNELSKL